MNPNPLAKLDNVTRALAEARSMTEIKSIIDIAEAARTYARAAKLGMEASNYATEIRLRAERKADEMLGQLERSKGGRPGENSSQAVTSLSQYATVLEENEINHMTAHRWRAVGKISDPVFELAVITITDAGEELSRAAVLRAAKFPLTAANHAISDDPDYDGDEWYTPEVYIQAARDVMGNIDLDPASCEEAQEVVKASSYYTKEYDALRDDCEWHGRIWLNPPYSAALIKQFISKLIDEYESGRVTQAIAITNNSSDTGWFHELLTRYPACFLRGRAYFWRPNREAFGTRQGQTLFYLGNDPAKFAEVFNDLGIVVTVYDD